MIKLERCYDVERIKSVFTHPDIWATIAEDNQIVDDFRVDFDSELYMAVYADTQLIGFYAFAVKSGAELDIHAQILPEHRKKHALASGKAILEWFYRDAPTRFVKLTAQVPFKYPNVKDFCLAVGMSIEGINRKSYRKNGEIFDQWHLGIMREEVKEIYELD